MESPVAKTIVTQAISAEAISAEATLVEGRSSIKVARPEARTRARADENVAATRVAAKPASTSKSAAMPAGRASPAAAHLRRGQQRRREQEDRHNDDRRRMNKAMHNKIISLRGNGCISRAVDIRAYCSMLPLTCSSRILPRFDR
jgi:hypothetical protein